jgi:hypothetical protein
MMHGFANLKYVKYSCQLFIMFVTGVTPSSDAPIAKLPLVLIKGKSVDQYFGCLPCYTRHYCELSSVLSGQLLIRCEGRGPGFMTSINCLKSMILSFFWPRAPFCDRFG